MKLGITVFFKHSVFSSGGSQAALAMIELYSLLGNTCSFITTSDSLWWDDIKTIQGNWPCVKEADVVTGQFDLILEVVMAPRLRSLAPCVWIVRKSPLFLDMESCVVPYTLAPRSTEGLAETWVYEELCTGDDIQYLELLTRRPVRKVPFLWSALAVETFRKETPLPIWQQSYVKGDPFEVRICETNTTSMSSCVIPLCIYKEGCKGYGLKVHNTDMLKESEYFQKNLWANLMDQPGTFVGRQRIAEIPCAKNTILIAHSRFTTIRPYHLEALWCGIPLVHNSELLCSLTGVERGYYPNNSITEGCAAVKRVEDWSVDLFHLRKDILHRFGLLSETIRTRWGAAAEGVQAAPAPLLALAPAAAQKPVLRIGFSDMWQDFNPSYNFFTLLLEHTFPTHTIEVSSTPDVLIFGPFGSSWEQTTVPKIHYTGENSPPIRRKDILLNLGFERRTDNYIRLPLWVLEIDWFKADARIQNPIPVSLDPVSTEHRDKFCAFIVSNGSQPVRNNAFHTLCKYKEVDSAGRLYNTLGDSLFAGAGGGGGEKRKVEFLKDYRFCLAYENAASPGYVTEKLFHAKVAGCVPIYWGAPDVETDFDMEGCIDARGLSDEELVARVKEVDENHDLWVKKASIPVLTEAKREEVFGLLHSVALAIMEVASGGASGGVGASAPLIETPLSNTVFMTGCSRAYIDILVKYWIPPLMAQRSTMPNLQLHVYLLHDVREEDAKKIPSGVTLFTLPKEESFPGCWNPQHFLWKLWLLKNAPKGCRVIYMDVGVFFCRWPREWLAQGDICFLEDIHDNEHMCSELSKTTLALTEAERKAKQIWAGAIVFTGGSERAVRIFDEAWVLGQNPDIIVGKKWTGVDENKMPFGHRHDQSILSVLSFRHGLPRYPLDKVYCHTSLRHTFMRGLSLYVHRGLYLKNTFLAEGIHSTWIINLDRRPDRMNRLPRTILDKAVRFPAIDGRSLRLTPALKAMFAPLGWRKGVMGCALSHISLWKKLVEDKPEIDTYLILEDDVEIHPQCLPMLNHIHTKMPSDWDVLYIGGVLPPNREGFTSIIEPVNDCIARVKENTLFSKEPSRYFHFCAYSYILRRSGAEKLLGMLDERGCWAPADHLLCNSHAELNIYFTHPLMLGCYQDSDPKYQTSDFNTFGKEEYDSDLRNEDVFTEDELRAAGAVDALGAEWPGNRIIRQALNDAVASVAAPVAAPVPVASSAEAKAPAETFPVFYQTLDLFERDWLELLLGKPIDEIRTEIPIVIYQRPFCEKIKEDLRTWPAFKLLHVSDERGLDPIDIYDWPACKGVVRNYLRKDLPRSAKVLTIPLGYHWASPRSSKTRDLAWSFIGADHLGRRDKLHPFKSLPNKCVFQEGWDSPTKCGKEEVVDSLERSLCVPCPGGVEYETFRIYEALEAGAVPLLVEEPGSEAFLAYLKLWIPLATAADWPSAARILHGLRERPQLFSEYRRTVLDGWTAMKKWAMTEVQNLLV